MYKVRPVKELGLIFNFAQSYLWINHQKSIGKHNTKYYTELLSIKVRSERNHIGLPEIVICIKTILIGSTADIPAWAKYFEKKFQQVVSYPSHMLYSAKLYSISFWEYWIRITLNASPLRCSVAKYQNCSYFIFFTNTCRLNSNLYSTSHIKPYMFLSTETCYTVIKLPSIDCSFKAFSRTLSLVGTLEYMSTFSIAFHAPNIPSWMNKIRSSGSLKYFNKVILTLSMLDSHFHKCHLKCRVVLLRRHFSRRNLTFQAPFRYCVYKTFLDWLHCIVFGMTLCLFSQYSCIVVVKSITWHHAGSCRLCHLVTNHLRPLLHVALSVFLCNHPFVKFFHY